MKQWQNPLERARSALDWTQADLSAHSDIPRLTIAGIEEGHTAPQWPIINTLAGVLMIEPKRLYRDLLDWHNSMLLTGKYGAEVWIQAPLFDDILPRRQPAGKAIDQP